VSDAPLSEEQIRDTLAAYLGLLQRHVSAEEMMSKILTDAFETGFVGGHMWKGLDGLRDFLTQREGFFDERTRSRTCSRWPGARTTSSR
jgi:hypothetical protein